MPGGETSVKYVIAVLCDLTQKFGGEALLSKVMLKLCKNDAVSCNLNRVILNISDKFFFFFHCSKDVTFLLKINSIWYNTINKKKKNYG